MSTWRTQGSSVTDGCRYASVSTSRSGTAGAGFSQLRVPFCNLKIVVGEFSLQEKDRILVALFHWSKATNKQLLSDTASNQQPHFCTCIPHLSQWTKAQGAELTFQNPQLYNIFSPSYRLRSVLALKNYQVLWFVGAREIQLKTK